jgi:hypothetical protein
MSTTRQRLVLCGVACLAALCTATARGDEIRLKNGQKLYGVIVAYEDNMFKVKTDFGYVLVEKDKIAAIIPAAPGDHQTANGQLPETEKPAAKPVDGKVGGDRAGLPPETVSKGESTAPIAKPGPGFANTSRPVAPADKQIKTPAPLLNSTTTTARTSQPVITSQSIPARPAADQPAKSASMEPPPNRESVQGNMYINYTHGFRIYKPPSWQLINDAPRTIPNAVVAMGTSNASTLMVVGEEKTKTSLDASAVEVEKRLRETYGNYQRLSERKTVAGGLPAVEIHYRGIADDHDWSGTLLIVARSGEIFSVLGMTYSSSDLIQIQENVIARAIASLEFTSN